MSIPMEIERKYVISMPDITVMRNQEEYTVSEIQQTYLESEAHVTRRVRARHYDSSVVYTETKKVRVDKMSAYEDEREISESEYVELLGEKKRGTVTIVKTRHTFAYLDKTYEVDIYPAWQRSCILEVELPSRDSDVAMPDFIHLITEVTGDRRYSNAAMSKEFPAELI